MSAAPALGRRHHRAAWLWQSNQLQLRILELVKDPKTIPPDVAKLTEAWIKLEALRMDLRMQPKPEKARVPIPGTLARLLQAQDSGIPNAKSPAHPLPEVYELPPSQDPIPNVLPTQELTQSNAEDDTAPGVTT